MHYPKLFFQKTLLTWLVVALCAVFLGALPAQAQPFAYVANQFDNTVSVIDVATNTVAATVPVGTSPVGVAITPDGTFAYVANNDDNTVSVIDVASNTVVATVPVGNNPGFVAITPDGAFTYVTNNFPNDVSVIATASNTVVATVPLGGFFQSGIAITPDGAFVYVVDFDFTTFQHQVEVIATASNTVVAVVPLGNATTAILASVAITPDGAFAYVTNNDFFITGESRVSVIATASNTVVATVSLGFSAFPFGVAITPDGAFAYVANYLSNDVSVIATASNTVVATVPVGASPGLVAITPDGAFAYVTNNGSNDVSVISTASNAVVANVSVGMQPSGIAITPALSVEALIDDLIAEIQAMNLQGGVANALISKLQNALASYQAGNYTAATNQLNAFINQCNAQRGKKLTDAQADELIAAAQAIIDQINSSAAAAVAKKSSPAVHAAAQIPPASEIRFSRSETGGMTMKYLAASGQELRTQSLSQERVAMLQQRLTKRGESGTPALPSLRVEKLMQIYATVLAMVENGDEVILTLPRDGKDFKITKVSGSASDQSPVTSYQLEQNYPNPFNPETEIRFALPEAGQVTVKIFNTTGQEIRTLANAPFQAGYQTLRWDGRDQSGNAVAAGIYLYQIIATGANGEVKFSATKRMAFVK